MKLSKEQTLHLENLLLKRDSFTKDLVMLENDFNIITKKRIDVVEELDAMIKKIGGKAYKENLQPKLNLEKQELTFEESNA